jgi:hypothetical protein
MKNEPTFRRAMYPFFLKIDPMEALFVISIKDDPEFEGLEPQTFDDAINGRGMRILRYRKNGLVDVYWQPGVRVDRDAFKIGKGTADFAETEISPARLEVTGTGVDMHYTFTDLQGRVNELSIRENAPGKRGFPLLAPVSANIENPIQFNVVYLPNFDLLQRPGTVVSGRIGDRAVRLDSIPMILHGHRIWLARYGAGTVIGVLNPPISSPIEVELNKAGTAVYNGMSVFADTDGNLMRCSAGPEHAGVEVVFDPSFPNLLALPDGGTASGRWFFNAASRRITGGTYRAANTGFNIEIDLEVLDHWKPVDLPFSVSILTTVVKVFKTWPATYRWSGNVAMGDKPSMTGKWERVRR